MCLSGRAASREGETLSGAQGRRGGLQATDTSGTFSFCLTPSTPSLAIDQLCDLGQVI